MGCWYHLYLDVNSATGTIKYNFPQSEPHELEDCCVLDIAAEGGLTLEEVAVTMNLTRERVRQLEDMALKKLQQATGLKNYLPGEIAGSEED